MGERNLHLSSGVGRNLFLAFLTVSLFSLASATVGWFGLGNVRGVQNRVLNEVYPSVRNAQVVARQSTEWVLQLSSLFDSQTLEQLDTRTDSVKSSERRIYELLSEVGDEKTSQYLRKQIEPRIQGLSSSADAVATLAQQVIEINSKISVDLENVLHISESINDAVKSITPAIVENTILNSEEISGDLRSGGGANNAAIADKFEFFSRRTIDDLQKITDLQFRSEAVLVDLLRFSDAGSSEGVKTIRDALTLNLRAITRSIVRIGIPELQQKIATPLAQLTSEVFKEDSIFALRESVFTRRDEMNEIRTSAESAQHEISVLVERFVEETQSAMENESAKAQDGSARIQYILATLAVLAFVVSAFVYVAYVNNIIIARLQRLSLSVKRLISGDFDGVVIRTGDDQITRLEEAVEAFRVNAIRLRETEISLTEYSGILEQSNKDLQQFAYVASHDLRAPLRGINSLSEWLEEDLAEGNLDEAANKLGRLRGRVERMDSLLNGILQYARAGNEDDDRAYIPFEETALLIFDDLNAEGRFQAVIKSESTPLFTGEAFMHQMLGNLISNAMKHHDKAAGNIEIELQTDGKLNTLSISDDGPGIPANMREKVLQMFQTLKARDEIEASGIGLALVEKLAVRRKGTVMIQDSTSGGARFIVEWPCETE